MRTAAVVVGVGLVFLVSACPDPDDGGAVDAGVNDGGSVADAGSGDGGADGGEVLPGALGSPCDVNTDCDSELCFTPFPNARPYCTTACGSDADCDLGDGLTYDCLQIRFGSACIRTCETNEDCGETGLCAPNVSTGTGLLNVCFQLEGLTCDNQADCSEGNCVLMSSGADLANYCESSEFGGTLPVGSACDPALVLQTPCARDADCLPGQRCAPEWGGICRPLPEVGCQFNWCHQEGVCLGPCAADADCPADMFCTDNYLPLGMNTADPTDDVFGQNTFCSPAAGSRTSCASNGDCAAGEACTIYLRDGAVHQVCRIPGENALAEGEACLDDLTTTAVEPVAPCASGFACYDGRCTSPCATTADCGDSAAWQCLTFHAAPNLTVNLCMAGTACSVDADCPATERCQGVLTTSGLAGRCGPPKGSGVLGETCDPLVRQKLALPCSSNDSCAGLGTGWTCGSDGLCKPPLSDLCETGICPPVDGLCTRACTSDADCPEADWRCAGYHAPVSNNGTPDPRDDLDTVTPICDRFAGSATPCENSAGCTVEGELCRLWVNLDGSFETRCGVPLDGAARPGDSCGMVGQDAIYCASRMCDLWNGDGNLLKGTCASPCTGDEECPIGTSCQDYRVVPHVEQTLKACRRTRAGVP